MIRVITSSSGGCSRARIILGTISCLLCRIYTLDRRYTKKSFLIGKDEYYICMKSTHRTTLGMFMHLSMHNLDSTSIAYNWRIPKGTARTMGSAFRQGTFPCASTSVIETTHFNFAYAFSKYLVRLNKGLQEKIKCNTFEIPRVAKPSAII